jgi:aldose 1-epimerase
MDLTLAAGPLRLCLRPGWGGRVVRLTHVRRGEILLPIEARRFDPEAWPRAGAYPLIPFHNRVEAATFEHAGRIARLPPHPAYLPHALHGMTSRMVWRGRQRAPGRADLTVERAADAGWPWRFAARQVFALDPRGLTVTLHLGNLDTAPMPGGLGWHPYFPAPARVVDDARIGWPLRPDLLPAHGPVARAMLSGPTLYLAQWRVVTVLLRGGLRVRLHRPCGLPHLVIHRPPGPFVCVEPVSHVANALNHPGQPDMGPIAPGARMVARVRLEISD